MYRRLLAASLMAALSGTASGGDDVHWGYSGEAGPLNWATLSADYRECTAGHDQSPINLTNLIDAELPPIGIRYVKSTAEVLNNGHTIQVNMIAGSAIAIDGIDFELKQFHFHAPSENQLEGKSFPLEAHLVHADRAGNLAVVAVMFTAGEANKVLAQAWRRMPQAKAEKIALPSGVDPGGMLPADRDYYRFSGSLTTPPCTEGVRWLVMKQSMTASVAQIDAFVHVIHHPNNRPVQALNARTVLK